MKINFLATIAFLTLLVFSGCKIGEDSPKRDFYVFEQHLLLNPVKQEYAQGDFVWMESDIVGKQLTDQATGKSVEVGNATFNVALNVLDTFADAPGLEKFELIPQNGVISGDANFKKNGAALISFGCPANDYTMKTGIQFKEKGGYLVYLNKSNPYFQVVFTGDSDCSLIKPNTIPPDEADVGTVHLTFAVDDSNRDKFDEYAAGFPEANIDLNAIQTALDNREAFFVWVK